MKAATPNERVCLQNCFDTGSGRYWVRRMRQLLRTPLCKYRIVSFCCVCFFRDHYDFGRKIAKLEIKLK